MCHDMAKGTLSGKMKIEFGIAYVSKGILLVI